VLDFASKANFTSLPTVKQQIQIGGRQGNCQPVRFSKFLLSWLTFGYHQDLPQLKFAFEEVLDR